MQIHDIVYSICKYSGIKRFSPFFEVDAQLHLCQWWGSLRTRVKERCHRPVPAAPSRTGSGGWKVCVELIGVSARCWPGYRVGSVCWADAAGGSGCTLTFSHDFSAQTVVNLSCGRSRCKKLSALVLLCSGTTSCLAFENTNVKKQRTLPFWCINYKISWKIVDSLCLFWKQFNLLKLLAVAENQRVMRFD